MTEFIAEICSNHNGDINRAFELIDTSARIGCDGVKFQLFRIDKLFAPEVLDHPDYQYVNERRGWELPLEWIPRLANRCKEHGLKFGCTPFYIGAVEALAPYVDFFKIASYELCWGALLKEVKKFARLMDKPVYLSTGMATISEVEWAVDILMSNDEPIELTLLHCVSSYPTPVEEINAGFIGKLTTKIALPHHIKDTPIRLGWSDHSVNPAVVYGMVSILISTIEFHLDLEDGQGVEYSLGHCWTPAQMAAVIETSRIIEKIKMGRLCPNDQDVSDSEKQERLWRTAPEDGLRPCQSEREKLRR